MCGFVCAACSPLSLFIFLLFLFPFYGVSDVMVLSLAAAKYFTQFNEYGLIQFIVVSKRLQFITTGLMSGTYAFGKLFVCATLRGAPPYPAAELSTSRHAPFLAAATRSALPHRRLAGGGRTPPSRTVPLAALLSHTAALLPRSLRAEESKEVLDDGRKASYFECENFAPGTHPTFLFEFTLFVIRSVLNWVVFALLWNFDSVVKTQRVEGAKLRAQQNLLYGAERRGLYPSTTTTVLMLLSWQLTIGAFVAALWTTGFDDVLGLWFDVLLVAALLQARPTRTHRHTRRARTHAARAHTPRAHTHARTPPRAHTRRALTTAFGACARRRRRCRCTGCSRSRA